MGIALKTEALRGMVSAAEVAQLAPFVDVCQQQLVNKTGAGCDFLGWVDLPKTFDPEEMTRIKTAARQIQQDSQVLVVIGIGGSYLGAKAALDFLRSPFYNERRDKDTPDVYFVGNSLSGAYHQQVLDLIGERDFSINIISKSGTTTESALAMRFFRSLLEERYGKAGAARRIYATTDSRRGALKQLADAEGYATFTIPDDVGGRYSVLTAVGLLPMAAAGIDIDQVMAGARQARERYQQLPFAQNDCARYAALRQILARKGKTTEILVHFEPALAMFGEWYRQLFAESEGKDNKGIFPVSAGFSTDLHSIGQFIQEGSRNLFETMLWCPATTDPLTIPDDPANSDGLNFLSGRSLHEVNGKAFQGTLLAHTDGGTPCLVLEIDALDESHFGQLVYFFEQACALSGWLSGVNPFDQPGVEQYKRNMFALLGKPGYEELKAALEGRLL